MFWQSYDLNFCHWFLFGFLKLAVPVEARWPQTHIAQAGLEHESWELGLQAFGGTSVGEETWLHCMMYISEWMSKGMNGLFCRNMRWSPDKWGCNWEKVSQFLVHSSQCHEFRCHRVICITVNCIWILIYVHRQNLTQSNVVFQFHNVEYW